MSRRRGAAWLCLLLAGVPTFTGCSDAARGPSGWSGPLTVRGSSGVRAVVYGNLAEMLPTIDVDPTLRTIIFGPEDTRPTPLRNPQGMTAGGAVLLVCDQGWPDVVAVSLASGRIWGWAGQDHRPRCPVDAAIDADGRVYVADTTLGSIAAYDIEGKFLEVLPSPGGGFRPASILVSGTTLYAGDIRGHTVRRFDLASRSWLAPLAPPATQKPIVAPTGLAMTDAGVLLVADAVQGQVARVDASGQWLAPIGKPGRQTGEFVRPKQVCIVAGVIAVTDAGRQSVMLFETSGKFLTEVHEQSGWSGFALPTGMVALSGASKEAIEALIDRQGWSRSDGYLVVSDSLGGAGLTLIGVDAGRGVARAAR